MKNAIIICLILFCCNTARAQSSEDGVNYLYYERINSAQNTFQALLKSDPNKGESWYYLVQSYLSQDSVSKASEILKFAPESVKADPFFRIATGAVLLHQTRNTEASDHFTKVLEDSKEKDVAILAAIARVHTDASSGDYNFAIELINKAIKREKNDPALYVVLGDAYRKLLNGGESFRAYEKAIEKNDKYALAYHRIGKLFMTQNNPAVYLEYFKKAIAADPGYAPSLYMLYVYEFYRDPAKSMAYYTQYSANADATPESQYDLTDLLYLNKQYVQSITKANDIIRSEGTSVKPRLFKLLGYSYAASSDTVNALIWMEKYINTAVDTNIVAKDYILLSDFYNSIPGKDSLAVVYLEKGSALEKDSTQLFLFYKKLAAAAHANKDYISQSKWLAKYYPNNPKATNLDLFNWGLAHYLSADYTSADSVFAMYSSKYPTQGFGYYWQAKSKSAQDTSMEAGLAVPAYLTLIDILKKDSLNSQATKWLIESYEYLAAYEANIKKDYTASLDYFKMILVEDPDNKSAQKYVKILEKEFARKNGG